MDRLTKEQRSKTMRAIKSKGSKIETMLSKALWRKGYRYRKNLRSVYGKPDIVFTKYKIAIFCDSEFWHGKDWETKKWEIKSRRDFWFPKIERNITRDENVNKTLSEQGYLVLRFWGEQIRKDLEACVTQVEGAIKERKNRE